MGEGRRDAKTQAREEFNQLDEEQDRSIEQGQLGAVLGWVRASLGKLEGIENVIKFVGIVAIG